jgi:hypothetical protein
MTAETPSKRLSSSLVPFSTRSRIPPSTPKTLRGPARDFLFAPGYDRKNPILAAANVLAHAVLEHLFAPSEVTAAEVRMSSRALEYARIAR